MVKGDAINGLLEVSRDDNQRFAVPEAKSIASISLLEASRVPFPQLKPN